jgi:outer membrane protein assembly factor BamB
LGVAWRAEIGRGHSAVAVRGDRLYATGMRVSGSGAGKTAEEIVYCLSATTGREIWRYSYRSAELDWPGPAATPVLDGDRLYTIGRQGEVYCLDAESGAVIWHRGLAEEKVIRAPESGFCSSPAVEGNLLLLNGGASGMALNKLTGKTVWSSGTEAGALSTPVLFGPAGKRQALMASRSTISAVDVATGKVGWSQRWDSTTDPILLGDRVLLTGGGRARASMLVQMRASAPKVLWSGEYLGGTFQTVLAIDGHAYGFAGSGRGQTLQCVDTATGQLKWRQDLGAWGSLIAVNRHLVVAEGDGDLVVVEATPAAFRETLRLKAIPMTAAETGASNNDLRAVWTAPAFDNGRVYVRDNFGTVVCIAPRS